MKVLGAGAVGLGLSGTSAAQVSEGGPPETGDWHVVFEDDFDGGGLDTSNWSPGWGWGMQTSIGSQEASERAISFGNSTLELGILNEGPVYPVGAVHTKNKVTMGPGSYVEAKCRTANLPGLSSNFWSKPNSEAWPPEIDFMEAPVRDSSDVNRTIHHIHWSGDGQPNGPHRNLGVGDHNGSDKSQNWTIFGCCWLEDSVAYYVDGQEFARTERSDVMNSLNNGAPFYIMLDVLNWPGPDLHPADFSGYKTTHEVDWIRLWEPGSGGSDSSIGGNSNGGNSTSGNSTDGNSTSGNSSSDGTESSGDGSSTDGGNSTGTEHYIWFRSADGTAATFAFLASAGNIRLDSSGYEAGFWISGDGTTAGGTIDRSSEIPGFWYEGSVTDLSYDGPLEVYVDDQPVDPNSLVDQSNPGPGEPTDDATQNDEPLTEGDVDGDSIDDSGNTSGNSGDDDTNGDDDSTTLPNVVTIDGSSANGSTSYSITVSDQLAATEPTNGDDPVSGATATGSVDGGSHEYAYSGSITALSLDGGADVYRNGSRMKLLTIWRAPKSSEFVTYLVESTGRLLKADVPASTINATDSVQDGRAYGRVGRGSDSYWVIDGEVVDVSTFGGKALTRLDGEVVDLAD